MLEAFLLSNLTVHFLALYYQFKHFSQENGRNELGALYTRVQLESLNLQVLGVWQAFIEAQTVESFINLQALNNLSNCNIDHAQSEIYQGGKTLNKEAFMTSQKNAWNPIDLRPTIWDLKLSTFLSWRIWPRACFSHSTWVSSRRHLSVLSPVEIHALKLKAHM
jgi:hypothetical protein